MKIGFIRDRKTSKQQYLTLDRIDNNKGYIKGNVAFCTSIANTIKLNLDLVELNILIQKILDII
jgi:hypothetical protein